MYVCIKILLESIVHMYSISYEHMLVLLIILCEYVCKTYNFPCLFIHNLYYRWSVFYLFKLILLSFHFKYLSLLNFSYEQIF